MSERNFEPHFPSDLWTMGFDVDLTLERDEVHGRKSSSGATTMLSCDSEVNGVHPSSLLCRLDDVGLIDEDITPLTDLTHALPRGREQQEESSQDFTVKRPQFDRTVIGSCDEFCSTNNSPKVLQSVDVCGKVLMLNGKLVIQLRNYDTETNGLLNVSECWLCRTQFCSHSSPIHKHILQGVFQTSKEFMQIDIDNLIIPDEALKDKRTKGKLFEAPSVACSGADLGSQHNEMLTITTPLSQVMPLKFVKENRKRKKNDSSIFNSGCLSIPASLETSEFQDNSAKSLPNTDPLTLSKDLQNSTHLPIGNERVEFQSNQQSNFSGDQSQNKIQSSVKTPSLDILCPSQFCNPTEVREEKSSKIDNGDITLTKDLKNLKVLPIHHEAKMRRSDTDKKACDLSILNSSCIPISNDNDIKSPTHFKCPLCEIKFSRCKGSKFKSHLLDHDWPANNSLRCPKCDWEGGFNALSWLKHIQMHFNRRYRCTLCTAHYSRAEKLRSHIDTFHKNKKPFVCNICSKAFSRTEYLKAHLNIHWKHRFECNVCGRSFSTKFNLSVHKRLHSPDKLVACKLCGQTFCRKDALSSHVATVHSKQRISCDICYKTFSRIDVLRRHQLLHKKTSTSISFNCTSCGKQFYRKDHLKSHRCRPPCPVEVDHANEVGEISPRKSRRKIKTIESERSVSSRRSTRVTVPKCAVPRGQNSHVKSSTNFGRRKRNFNLKEDATNEAVNPLPNERDAIALLPSSSSSANISLSTEAISAAAYLLIHPLYEG